MLMSTGLRKVVIRVVKFKESTFRDPMDWILLYIRTYICYELSLPCSLIECFLLQASKD